GVFPKQFGAKLSCRASASLFLHVKIERVRVLSEVGAEVVPEFLVVGGGGGEVADFPHGVHVPVELPLGGRFWGEASEVFVAVGRSVAVENSHCCFLSGIEKHPVGCCVFRTRPVP